MREKMVQLRKMNEAAERERGRLVLACDEAGIAKAEMARALGCTPASILGYVRTATAERDAAAAKRKGGGHAAAPDDALVVVGALVGADALDGADDDA